jgi:cytosine/adenosine deaminase-related metal-dependent hydrolase
VVVLAHVRVIDGTGRPSVDEQNVVIEGAGSRASKARARMPQKEGTTVLDLRGHSVMPGIVGMHNHLYASPDRTSAGADPVFDAPLVVRK